MNRLKHTALITALMLTIFSTQTVCADDGTITEVLPKLFPKLEEGLELVDEQRKLPDSSWLGSDKKSKQEDINDLLDDALEALELSDVQNFREDIQDAEEEIEESRKLIAQYRRDRLTAPEDSTLGLNQLPLYVSKAGYDAKIKREQEKIDRHAEFLYKTQNHFLTRVKSIGIELNSEQFEVLLSTVNGDDFLDMALAFETVKGITEQLQNLTQESGEDIETARKYYGLYTVLLRILNHTQNKFIEDIEKKHIPRIQEYETSAEENIESARIAIQKGGDSEVLEQNIESNRFTRRALTLYREYLLKQKIQIEQANEEIQRQILTADNTYSTVLLASEVVTLLQKGVKSFEALRRLSPPDLSGFENQALRDEFSKLTELMRKER